MYRWTHRKSQPSQKLQGTLTHTQVREKEYKRILNELSEKENSNMASHAKDIEKIVK